MVITFGSKIIKNKLSCFLTLSINTFIFLKVNVIPVALKFYLAGMSAKITLWIGNVCRSLS